MLQKAKAVVKIPELARLLGIDYRTVRAAVRRGELRAFKLGRGYYIPVAEVERLLEGALNHPEEFVHSE